MVFFACFVLFDSNLVKGDNVFYGLEIYNIQSSNKYLAIEYNKNINGNYYHYISLYDYEKEELLDIYNEQEELINDHMYFPSISNDGRFLVFTSRANNIVNESIPTCYDIYDGINKICNSVYIYDTVNKKFSIVKSNGSMLNGDSYVAKISGNGNYVVFESIAHNLINGSQNCEDLNGINACINIYKYNFLNDSIELISTNFDGNGGNRNSVSPSIDYEGRYVVYQSNSNNIIRLSSEYNYCYNTYKEESEPCTNIYLVDTLKGNTNLISRGDKYVLNNHNINPIISQNGLFVTYESYATNIFPTINHKKHIILYDINKNTNTLISVSDNHLNNRDNHIEDISYDGKYILYRTTSTNLNSHNNIMKLYICNVSSFKTSAISNNSYDILYGIIEGNNIYYYDDANNIEMTKIDSQSPKIAENQNIYVLKNKLSEIFDKVNVTDNLSGTDKLQIYLMENPITGTGTYCVTVIAIDEFGNRSSNVITINVLDEDLEGPVFNKVSYINVLRGSDELNLSDYISAEDKIDGIVRIFIVDDGGLNLDKSGSYTIKLKATDNSNNSEYTDLIVVVYDNYNFSFFYEILLVLTLLFGLIFLLIKVK